MKKLTIVSAGAVALALAAGFIWSQRQPEQVVRVADDVAAQASQPTSTAHTAETKPAASTPTVPLADEPVVESAPSSAQLNEDEHSEDPVKMFRADPSANLVLTERTRLNIEKLSALYTADERQRRLAAIEQTLPARAYRQLVDLMERHDNFTRDSRQALPPGREASTVEEAIAQHDSLHALRVAHFGADAADALYGDEERIGRQLLDFMSLEKHEGLTMEEKAVKAQEMLLQSPELLAAYEKNRAAASEQK